MIQDSIYRFLLLPHPHSLDKLIFTHASTYHISEMPSKYHHLNLLKLVSTNYSSYRLVKLLCCYPIPLCHVSLDLLALQKQMFLEQWES